MKAESLLLNPLNKAETSTIKYITSLKSVKGDDRIKKTPDDVIFIGFDFKKVNYAIFCKTPDLCDVSIYFQVDNPKYHKPQSYPIKYVSRNNRLYTPQINNVTWESPHSPLLTQPENTEQRKLCNTHSETQQSNQDEVTKLPLPAPSFTDGHFVVAVSRLQSRDQLITPPVGRIGFVR